MVLFKLVSASLIRKGDNQALNYLRWIKAPEFVKLPHLNEQFRQAGLLTCSPFTATYDTFCEKLNLPPSEETSREKYGEFLRLAVVYSDCFTPPPAVRPKEKSRNWLQQMCTRQKSVELLETVSEKLDKVTKKGAQPLGAGAFGAVYKVKVTTVDTEGKRRNTLFDVPVIKKTGEFSESGWAHSYRIMVREILMLRLFNWHRVASVPALRSSGIKTEGPQTTVNVCMAQVSDVKSLNVLRSEIRLQVSEDEQKKSEKGVRGVNVLDRAKAQLKLASKVALAVATAIEQVHAMVPKIVHRDLNPDNILVSCTGSLSDSEVTASIIDPAMAVFEEGDQDVFVFEGTSRGDCQSPELFLRKGCLMACGAESIDKVGAAIQAQVTEMKGENEYPPTLLDAMIAPSQKSDVFAAGLYFYNLYRFESLYIIWESIGDPLEPGRMTVLRFSQELTKLYDLGKLDEFPELKLTASMLHLDPDKRPTMKEVVQALTPPVRRSFILPRDMATESES